MSSSFQPVLDRIAADIASAPGRGRPADYIPARGCLAVDAAHVYIGDTHVGGSDDLDADFQSFKGRGVQVVAEPADHPEWGIRVAYLRDPDGNLIEINSPIPHEEWTDELKAEAQKYENRTPPN